MSNQLLEQYVRMQVAVSTFVYDVRERMNEQRGQTTVEWLAIMVGLIALAAVISATSVWTDVGSAIAKAVGGLVDKVAGKAQ